MSEIYKKLSNIQNELKAPKSQLNKFGGYYYRSCEDIMEAVKPICKKYGAVLLVSDDIILVANRIYVKATARLVDTADGEFVEVTANARESETKKGMDDAQITGATSSYARKYALNGLFNIDDTKDADTDEYKNQVESTKQAKQTKQVKQEPQKITKTTLKDISVLATEFAKLKNRQIKEVYEALQTKFNYTDINELTEADGKTLITTLVSWNRQVNKETPSRK